MKSMKVLVTGSAGAIGRSTCRELLSRGHQVRGLDRSPMPELTEAWVGNLTDGEFVRRATEGMDAVVHLAATPDDADFMTELLPNNIIGLYHVFEAARSCGVRRLIVTSTGQVVDGIAPKEGPIRIEDGVAPRNHYAVTKTFAEMMAEMYAHRFGMSIVVIRPGWLPREPWHVLAMSKNPSGQAVYMSPRDAGRAFACAVEAENVHYAVVFTPGRSNGAARFDLTAAKKWIGYEPLDTYPEGLPFPIPKE